MTDRMVVGRVVSLEGGQPVVSPFVGGPKPANGDRIAALIVSARAWKKAKAEHGLSSSQAAQALDLMKAAAEAID